MEYKFRAIKDDMSDPCFVYGDLIYTDDGIPRILTDRENMLFTTCIKGTEGQYVGGVDIKGTHMYAGDIIGLNCNMVDDYTGKQSIEVQALVIIFDDDKYCWSVYCPTAMIKDSWGYIPRGAIIGNIHTQTTNK